MVATNDEELTRNGEACLKHLYEAAPGLARPVAQRAFESHLRDLLAVVTAYLKGELEWPGALIGIEAAYLQARACLDDRACVEALAEATVRVARVAGKELDALTAALEEADRTDRQSTTPEASGTEVAGSGVASTGTEAPEPDGERPQSGGAPASGTGFALSVSNSKANPKVQISYPKPKPYPKPKSEASTS